MELGIGICGRTQGVVVLAVSGDIDIHSAPEIRDCLATLQNQGHSSIIVDLSDVTFLDSSALGALVGVHRLLAEAGGTLKLAAPRPHVMKVFRITRLLEVIPLYDSVDAACA